MSSTGCWSSQHGECGAIQLIHARPTSALCKMLPRTQLCLNSRPIGALVLCASILLLYNALHCEGLDRKLYIDAFNPEKCGDANLRPWQEREAAYGCSHGGEYETLRKLLVDHLNSSRHEKSNLGPIIRSEPATQNRINDGSRAAQGEFPSFVKLITIDSNDQTYHCGGVLVHNNLVLTASHCVTKATAVRVYLGSISNHESPVVVYADKWCYDQQDLETLESYRIRDFKDMGMVRLRTPVQYVPNKIGPACMTAARRHSDSTVCSLTGMGITRAHGMLSDRLLTLRVRRRNEQINEPYWATYKSDTTGQACSGDSGSPIICYDRCETKTSRSFVVGIVSAGDPDHCVPGMGRYFFANDLYNRMNDFVLEALDALKNNARPRSRGLICTS